MKNNITVFFLLFFSVMFYSCELKHETKTFDEWCQLQHNGGKPVVESFSSSSNFDSIRVDFLKYYKTVLAQSYLNDSNIVSETDKQKQYDMWYSKIEVTEVNKNLHVYIPLDYDLIYLHEQNLSFHDKDQYESKVGYCIFSFMKAHFDTLFITDGLGSNKSFDLNTYRNELEQKEYKYFTR